jgi:Flp pilus assembly protein TadD
MAGPAHPVSVVRSLTLPAFYGPLVALTAIAAVLALVARHNRRRGIYLFCLAWIAVTIAPSLNVVAYQQRFIQDRYLYLPSAGWCVMIADLAIVLSRGSVRASRIAWGALVAIAALYSVVLWNVQSYWRDETALYSRCIEMFPQLAECHGFLGLVMYGRGELRDAERELAKSISLEPAIGPDDGDSLYALGLIHLQSGRTQEAATELAQSLKVTVNPAREKYVVMAVLYDARGLPAQSEATIREVSRLPGGAAAAGVARAMIAMNHGDLVTTEASLRNLAQSYPDDALVWNSFGQILEIADKREEAVSAFRNAIKLAPGDPRLHLAVARTLHGLARDREAIDECRRVLALAPDNGEAQALMAEIQRNFRQK